MKITIKKLSTNLIALLIGFSCISYSQAIQPSNVKVRINNESQQMQTSIQSFILLPQDSFSIEIESDVEPITCNAHPALGSLQMQENNQWHLTVPNKPGIYSLSMRAGKKQLKLNLIVMIPYETLSRNMLNGYRIGCYPKVRKIRKKIYHNPRGFIEVTRDNKSVFLTPHFKLAQFLCKQSGDYPKYIVLDEALLMKLEELLERVQDQGIKCSSFAVLSGYRTPHYNRQLGNVPYSLHLYGKAADIYIDEDHNGLMDDLNKDGSLDYRDAKILYHLVNQLEADKENESMIGGLALYGWTTTHSPFVHVDVRGYQARWGNHQEIKQVKRRYGRAGKSTN